jgi:hypothetical protein
MASGAAKRRTVRETVTEVEADDADETSDEEATTDDAHLEAPIFPSLLRQAKRIETISVRRTDPDSGYLGSMSPDMTEAMLKAKWGGGTYCLEGKNSSGQLVKNARHICKLAGDPVFSAELEEKQWRKANGLPDKAAAPAAGALSIKDLLLLIDEKDEKRRTEQLEREERARKESDEREARERTAREEREAKERAAREEIESRRQKEADEREERRRREAREDEERRSRQHKEDMERLAAQNTSALQQTQQFFNQLATTMKTEAAPAADPIKTLMAGVQLAQAIGGGGGGAEEGTVASLVRRLPETLAEIRKTGAAAFSELKNGGGAGRRRGGAAAAAEELTIRGPLAAKAKTVLMKLQAAGRDPTAEMEQLLTFAAANIPDTPAKPAPGGAARAARRPTQVRRRPQPRAVKSRR